MAVPTRSVYVGNIPYTSTIQTLMEAFAEYEPISAKIVEGKGVAFIEVPARRAYAMVRDTDGSKLEGRLLSVSVAKPRENEPTYTQDQDWGVPVRTRVEEILDREPTRARIEVKSHTIITHDFRSVNEDRKNNRKRGETVPDFRADPVKVVTTMALRDATTDLHSTKEAEMESVLPAPMEIARLSIGVADRETTHDRGVETDLRSIETPDPAETDLRLIETPDPAVTDLRLIGKDAQGAAGDARLGATGHPSTGAADPETTHDLLAETEPHSIASQDRKMEDLMATDLHLTETQGQGETALRLIAKDALTGDARLEETGHPSTVTEVQTGGEDLATQTEEIGESSDLVIAQIDLTQTQDRKVRAGLTQVAEEAGLQPASPRSSSRRDKILQTLSN